MSPDFSLVSSESTRLAFEAAFWLSLFAAPLGALLIFRRLSFFGDALGHASLGGIAIAFLIAGTSLWALSLGALVSVVLTSFLLNWFETKMRFSSDIALTVSYAGLFATGLLVLGFGSSSSVHLEHFLVGDIWSTSEETLWFLRIWAPLMLALIIIFWKPLWVSVLDRSFARVLGFNVRRVDLFFLVVTSLSVVGMMQSVGIVLIAAYLILPSATALPWVRSLKALVIAGVLLSMMAGFEGLYLSTNFGWKAGPAIAFCAFVNLLISSVAKLALKPNTHR